MCHHRESSPEWEALVEKELRAEEESSEEATEPEPRTEDESAVREPAEPSPADD